MFKKSGPSVSTTAYTLRRVQKVVAIGAALLLVGGVGFYVSDRGSGTAHADDFPQEMEMPQEYTNTADPFETTPPPPEFEQPPVVEQAPDAPVVQPDLPVIVPPEMQQLPPEDGATRANMGEIGNGDPCSNGSDPTNAVGWGNVAAPSANAPTSPCDDPTGTCGADDGTENAVGWGNSRRQDCGGNTGADI